MEIIKPGTNFDFVGKMKWAAIGSAILLAVTVILWYTVKPNFGIDFVGGTEVDVTFTKTVSIGDVRSVVEGLKLGNAEIKRIGGSGDVSQNYIIRIEKKETVEGEGGEHVDVSTVVLKALEEKVAPYDKNKVGTSIVGPRAGKELRDKAFTAMVFSLVLMLIYVAIRFDAVSGVGAIIALFHDVGITVGFIVLTHREFSLTTIAALLTIVGYSINDTIVIYDRIRENAKKLRAKTLVEQINTAINETLSRTFLTSGVTMLSIIALVILTRGTVQDFGLAMIVGMISGTYSTIYIASAFVVLWKNKIAPAFIKDKKKRA